MQNPHNRQRVAPDGTNGPAVPLDPHTVLAALQARAQDEIRKTQPEVRGRGVKVSARVKDARRGRPYSTSNLLAVLADLIVDPRLATQEICDVLSGLELEVRALRGETADAPELWDAHTVETSVQGHADVAMCDAIRTHAPGAMQHAIDALGQHAAALTRCRLSLTAELRAMTSLSLH